MEKYEVESFFIDNGGELVVERKTGEGEGYLECPFATQYKDPQEISLDYSLAFGGGYFFGRRCGTWCPLFGEVEEDAICQIKSISLCHKTIWCRIKQGEQKDS